MLGESVPGKCWFGVELGRGMPDAQDSSDTDDGAPESGELPANEKEEELEMAVLGTEG